MIVAEAMQDLFCCWLDEVDHAISEWLLRVRPVLFISMVCPAGIFSEKGSVLLPVPLNVICTELQTFNGYVAVPVL